MILDYQVGVLQVSGYVILTIDQFVHVSGQFAFSKSTNDQSVTLSNGTPKSVTMMKVGAKNVNAFVGTGGPYWIDNGSAANPAQIDAAGVITPGTPDGMIDTNDKPNADGAMGLVLTNLEFGLALMKPAVAAGQPASAESYYALKASGSVALVGVDGLTLRANNLTIEVNGGKNPAIVAPAVAPAVNFVTSFPASSSNPAGLRVQTGQNAATDFVTLDFTGPLLRARGEVTIIIDGFVYVSGRFAFEKGDTRTIKLADNTPNNNNDNPTKSVSVLTIGAKNVNVFVGTGEPDSNGDKKFDSADDPAANGAIGLKLTNLEFGMALMKPTAVADRTSYFALNASADGIALVGVPGVTIGASQIDIKINSASAPATGGATATAPPAVVDFKASFPSPDPTDPLRPDGLKVTTGPTPTTDFKFIDFTTRLLAASGNVTLALDFDDNGQPEISLGTFISFEQTTRPNNTKVIKIALSQMNLSLGDPPVLSITNASGLVLITPQGMAAQFDVPVRFGAMAMCLDSTQPSRWRSRPAFNRSTKPSWSTKTCRSATRTARAPSR